MKPFKLSSALAQVTASYPAAEEIRRVVSEGTADDRVALARQWLSEGIPFAFQHCPAVYGAMRAWLSSRLSVEAKQISLVGTARLGSSLSPDKFGQSFDVRSDLDLFIVSARLFQCMTQDFERWLRDFRSGSISPANDKERTYWSDHESRGPRLVERGFMDTSLIPTRGGYDRTKVHETLWLLRKKLSITELAPGISKASLRCYSSWHSFERQVSLSLQWLASGDNRRR